MKKTVLFFTVFILSVSTLFSQAPYSSLTFFSEDGYPFTLIMNGLKKNQTPRTNVKVEGLTNPAYKVKIIFEDRTIPSIDKNVYTKPGMEITYRIKKDKKGNNVLRFYSEAPLPVDYVYNEPVYQDEVYIEDNTVVTNTGGTNVNINMNVNETGGSISIQTDEGGVSLNTNVNISDENVSYNSNVYETETHYEVTETHTGGHYVMPGYNGRIGCPWPMSPANFQRAKQTITNADFSDDKKVIAKQVVRSNCLTAEQVKQLASLFDFEDDKLDFAKFAYNYTYDIENYFIINDIFDFSSSIQELNNYINSVR